MKKVHIFLLLIISWAAHAQYTFVHYPNTNDVESGITTFGFEGDDNIWAGTVAKGVYHFSNGQYMNISEANSNLQGTRVYKILLDLNNTKWIGTEKGLNILAGDHFEFYTTENSSLLSNQVTSIAVSPRGRMWISTVEGISEGLFGKSYNMDNSPLPVNLVNSIYIDDNGLIWLGSGLGVTTFDGTNWNTYYSGPDNFPDGIINDINADDEGNIWISIAQDGIYGQLAKFDGTKWTTIDESDGYIFTARVTQILNDGKGKLWFGTHHEGLACFDGSEWIFYTTSNSGLPVNQIMSLGLSPSGNIWLGSRDGLTRMETVVSDHAGVSENRGIVIYPNPFSETVRISLPDASQGPYQLFIYDYSGREFIGTSKLAKLPVTFSKSELPSGMYIIRISDHTQSYCSKIISR